MKIQSMMRLVYVDLVKRRTTVRVVEARPELLDEEPIFLVGVYRSGTTLLRYVVDSHPDVACPPESDFLNRLAPLLQDERAANGLLSMGYDHGHVATRLAAFADYFFGNYARSKGKSRWADKSPSYVDHVAFLREIF